MTGKGLRRAVREFNLFIRDAPEIGSAPDRVSPGEKVIKTLVYNRKNRTFKRVSVAPKEGT